MSVSRPLQATAIAWIVTSIAHVASADWQKEFKFKQLPNTAYTCGKAGWYQGGAFLFMTGLINYHWAQNPEQLQLPVNKAIAAVATAIMWASSAWYLRRGLRPNSAVTALMGGLQAWAALWA